MRLNPLSRPGRRDGIPVAPGAFPLIGHLPVLIPSLQDFVVEQARALGPVFWVNRGFGDYTIMVTGEPALKLLRNTATASRDGAAVIEPVVGGTMIMIDGPPHRRMRGAAARTFSPRGLRAAEAGPIMAEVITRRVGAWEGARELAIVAEARDLALDIIFRIVEVDEGATGTWRRRFDELLLGFINLPLNFVGTPRWRSERARRWLDDAIEALVERAGERGEGLVAALARGRDEDGRGLTQRELIANLRLLLFAGHETTATAISWVVFHLAHDEGLWTRLCAEVGPDAELPVNKDDMARYPFALGLFREVLRLHPPIGLIGRVVTEELSVLGHALPVGSSVSVCVRGFGRDPARFAEPERVLPERWADRPARPGSIDTLPFGAGPHFCLGYHLACWEGVQFTVGLASALQRWGKRLAPRPLPRAYEYPIARPSKRERVRLVDA